jgi:hypothetical protein
MSVFGLYKPTENEISFDITTFKIMGVSHEL